jgi:hypothetical protein
MHHATPSATADLRPILRYLLALGLAAGMAAVDTAYAQVIVAAPTTVAVNEQGFVI